MENKSKVSLKIIVQLFHRLTGFVVSIILLMITTGSLLTVSVYSQDNERNSGSGGGLTSLSSCTPDSSSGQDNGGSQVIIQCFQQISRIVLIFGILVAAIMTARDSLRSYIPGEEVDATKDMKQRLINTIIGIVLIALPGSILSLFNPAATNLDFLSGLGEIRELVNSGREQQSGTAGDNQEEGGQAGGTGNTPSGNGNVNTGAGGGNQDEGGTNNLEEGNGNNPRQSPSRGDLGSFVTGEEIYEKNNILVLRSAVGESSCTNVTIRNQSNNSRLTGIRKKVCGDPNSIDYYGNIPFIEAKVEGGNYNFVVKEGVSLNCNAVSKQCLYDGRGTPPSVIN